MRNPKNFVLKLIITKIRQCSKVSNYNFEYIILLMNTVMTDRCRSGTISVTFPNNCVFSLA